MKKYFLMILMIGFFSSSFGENINTSGTLPENAIQPGQEKIINQTLDIAGTTDLDNIKVMFCNAWKEKKMTEDLSLQMRPGQRKEICIAFFNQGDKPVDVLFGFSAGKINKDGNPVCDGDMNDNNDFSKFILYNSITGITVPAQGNVIRKVSYLASKNVSGNVLGCLAYKLDREEKIEEGKMFLVIVRKVRYIYINIAGSVYRLGRRDDIKDIGIHNKASILKGIIAILTLGLLVTIFTSNKKKEKQYKKK